MFGNRKDPMIDTVQKVMDENARRRQIEADLNEELGIQDRKQLGHEKHDLYDQALSQRINEAKDVEANKKPPFDPDPPREKRPDEPKTAKGLAKQAMRDIMRDMKDKAAKDTQKTQKTFPNVKHLTHAGNPDWHKHGYKDMPIKEEEQIDEERKRTSAVSSAFLAGKPAKQKELQTNGQEMTYHGNVIAKHAGDEVHVTTAGYGHSPSTRGHINGVLNRLGAPGLSQKKGKLMHGDTEVGTRDWIKIKKPTATMSEEQIDELSKKTLGSYIKKASHDAAHKSTTVGKMSQQSRTKYAEKNVVGGREDNDAAEKSYGKSWKRREGIAKAVDKLTNEDLSLESIQEEIRNNLLERANRLLEHGSQDQIVEFMNDLTLEQRSILNMQEANPIGRGIASYVKGTIAGLKGGSQASNAAALGNKATQAGAELGGNVRSAVEPVAAKVSDAGKAVSNTISANPVKSVVGAAAAGAGAATLSGGIPKATTATPAATPASRAPVGDQERSDADNNSNNKLTAATPAAATAGAAKPASAAARPAPRASAPAAARPEIRRTGEGGTETAQDFNYNQANGAYNEPKAAAAPRAARAAAPAAAAANKPAAAATSATSVPKRSGSDIGSSVAGGDDRLAPERSGAPEPERLGNPQYHKSQDAAANLAGLQKSATDSAEKTASAFGPGTQTAKPANKPEPSVSSFEVKTPSKTAGMRDDAQAASDSGIHGIGKPKDENNLEESRNFERFLRNR